MEAAEKSQPSSTFLPLPHPDSGKNTQVDSRKTARGASSPAKPALHIPELYPWYQLWILMNLHFLVSSSKVQLKCR